MENSTRITFSAITHIGTACTFNDDRIYSNGRFMLVNDADYSRTSLDISGRRFLFALSDGMDSETSGLSVMEDVKKLHEKFKNSTREMQVKLDELADCIEQSNNLLYSISLGETTERSSKPAFSGILIEDGCIAAINLGSCRIYKLDGDNLKLMVNDYKRTERLLKMGIINDEQAEMLSGQHKAAGTDGRASVRKTDILNLKKGTLYLMCSKGLLDSVSEDTVYDIVASGGETDMIAEMLVKEAIDNEAPDNVSVAVIRVEETGGQEEESDNVRTIPSRNISGRIGRVTRNVRSRRLDVTKFVTNLIVFVVIAAVIFGAFTFWLNFRGLNSKDTLGGQTAATAETTAAPTEADLQDEDVTAGNTVESSTAETSANQQTGGNGNTAAGNAAGTNKVPASGTTYKVKPGDNLMAISQKFYGNKSSYKLIMEANKITNPDKITVGQELKIPPVK